MNSTIPASRSLTCLFALMPLMSLAGACSRTALDSGPRVLASTDASSTLLRPDDHPDVATPDTLPDIAPDSAPDLGADFGPDLSPRDALLVPDAPSPVDLPSDVAIRDVGAADRAGDAKDARVADGPVPDANSVDARVTDGPAPDANSVDTHLTDSRKNDSGEPESGLTPAKLESYPGGFLMDRLVGTTPPPFAVTVTNIGGTSTGPLRVEISGTNAAVFEIVGDTCDGSTLAPGATCKIPIVYASTATTRVYEMATLTITDTAPGGSIATVSMMGDTVLQ
jgi:hypothetical protein